MPLCVSMIITSTWLPFWSSAMQIKEHDLFCVRCFSYREKKDAPCKQITSDTRKKKKIYFSKSKTSKTEQTFLKLSSYILLFIYLLEQCHVAKHTVCKYESHGQRYIKLYIYIYILFKDWPSSHRTSQLRA